MKSKCISAKRLVPYKFFKAVLIKSSTLPTPVPVRAFAFLIADSAIALLIPRPNNAFNASDSIVLCGKLLNSELTASGNFPFNSRIMRCAVFPPTPFTFSKALLSPFATILLRSREVKEDRISLDVPEPTPDMESNFLNVSRSASVAKPYKTHPSSLTCKCV
jgi:hypothetical protein